MNALAMIRKLILCIGLLVSALLFLYPPWLIRLPQLPEQKVTLEHRAGRAFILSPPNLTPGQLRAMLGLSAINDLTDDAGALALICGIEKETTYRIHTSRWLAEVALSLLFTLGIVRVLKSE